MSSEPGAILLDANLLVLLVVGTTSRTLIAKHKKAKLFTALDFDKLVKVLGRRPVFILPHIAAEASNLIGFHEEPGRKRLFDEFKSILEAIDERFVSSRLAAAQREFCYLGLTDAAILLADPDAEILTTDATLHNAALRRGRASINFNHLR